MRNFILLFVLCWSSATFAQTEKTPENAQPQSSKNLIDDGFSLGLAGGINNPCGLMGVNGEFPSLGAVSIGFGLGVSTWGDKFYIDVKHYMKPSHLGWAFGGGISYNSGLNNFTTDMQTIYNTTEQVTLNLKPQTNLFAAAYRYYKIGRGYNRFYYLLGFTIPLTARGNYEQIDGTPISNNAQQVLQLLSPGGLMIGAGFNFSLKSRG
jgi:hypothetical protein